MIIALEIYLADYVDKIDVKEKSPDIIKIINDEVNTCIHDKEECICISFNYTHTFSRVYGIEINDFIHGEARVDRKVLGEEEVIKRTSGTTKTISFIKQQNF